MPERRQVTSSRHSPTASALPPSSQAVSRPKPSQPRSLQSSADTAGGRHMLDRHVVCAAMISVAHPHPPRSASRTSAPPAGQRLLDRVLRLDGPCGKIALCGNAAHIQQTLLSLLRGDATTGAPVAIGAKPDDSSLQMSFKAAYGPMTWTLLVTRRSTRTKPPCCLR